MRDSLGAGFGGVSGVEKELSEQERLEQETRNHFQRSENCGVAAYAELTGKVPKEKVEEIYRKQGALLEDSVRSGYLFFGNVNYRPETPVQNPQDYIRAFKSFIEQQKQKAEETEAATPEQIEEMKRHSYRSSVDGKKYNNTAENWRYHFFSGGKENYELLVEEARSVLEGFGKSAMEAGDAVTAKETLEYIGYLQTLPELVIEELDKEIERIKKAEQERLEQETRNYFQQSENCGVAAYAELTGKVPKEKVEEIYRKQGALLEDSVRSGYLFFRSLTNFQPETPVQNPQDYIRAFKHFIEQQKQKAEEAEAATPEQIEEMKRRSYHSSVDGKKYNNTAENWRYHTYPGKDTKETHEARAEEARSVLEGFGKSAMETGDNITYNLVQETLKELE